jgi:hypothetical protein
MMEAVRTSETSVDNHFTRQYNPEDSSEQWYCCSLQPTISPAVTPADYLLPVPKNESLLEWMLVQSIEEEMKEASVVTMNCLLVFFQK